VLNKLALVVVALALVLLVQTRATPTTGTFLTAVSVSSGPTPFVGIVTTADKALAYICDGEGLAQWYRGPIQAGGLFEVRSTTKKSRITAQINGRSVVGALTLEDGRVLQFRAIPSEGPAGQVRAGLYRSDDRINDVRYLGGWVVLPNGEQRGAVTDIGSTRPGFMLEFRSNLIGTNIPGLGPLKPFMVTPEFVENL
jgi:hypothetical protein